MKTFRTKVRPTSTAKNIFVAGLMLFSTATPLLSQEIIFKSAHTQACLVELYSSEGCSSCPPAEACMNNLKSKPGLWKDIFPLAFHVDYWDGLGWPDRFARSEYTERQRNYAASLGQDSVYTPEFIVNGHEWRRGWFDGQNLPAANAEKSGELSVSINAKGDELSAQYVPAHDGSSPSLYLNVALLGFDLVTDVKRGENGGRQLHHDFVVLGFTSTPLKAASDKKLQADSVSLKSSTSDAPGAVVAWVSQSDGTILQIAGGWLKP